MNYRIIKHIVTLSKDEEGWTREINIVSWYGGTAKYDFRTWNHDLNKAGKGFTMSEDEFKEMLDAIEQ